MYIHIYVLITHTYTCIYIYIYIYICIRPAASGRARAHARAHAQATSKRPCRTSTLPLCTDGSRLWSFELSIDTHIRGHLVDHRTGA